MAVNAVWDPTTTPDPNNKNNTNNLLGVTHSADTMSHVCHLIFDDDSTVGTVAAMGYSSDSSGESHRKPRASRASTRDKAKGHNRSKSRLREAQTAKNNPYKYCKQNRHRNCHPNVSSSQCYWNKKWQGFHPRYVCRALDMPCQEQEVFSAELGGYNLSGGETSDEE